MDVRDEDLDLGRPEIHAGGCELEVRGVGVEVIDHVPEAT